MMIPLWVVASTVSGCITLGFGAGVFTANFVSKKEFTTFQQQMYDKMGQIFDRIEDLKVEFARHVH